MFKNVDISMSRRMHIINLHINSPKSKLETLSETEHQIFKDCFFTSFDLANCYFHVRLHPDYRKYFSFKIIDEKGIEKFYVFLVMCYGISIATEVINKLTKPIKSLIHILGIIFSIYIGRENLIFQKIFSITSY